jgi:hypothetical protein
MNPVVHPDPNLLKVHVKVPHRNRHELVGFTQGEQAEGDEFDTVSFSGFAYITKAAIV